MVCLKNIKEVSLQVLTFQYLFFNRIKNFHFQVVGLYHLRTDSWSSALQNHLHFEFGPPYQMWKHQVAWKCVRHLCQLPTSTIYNSIFDFISSIKIFLFVVYHFFLFSGFVRKRSSHSSHLAWFVQPSIFRHKFHKKRLQ